MTSWRTSASFTVKVGTNCPYIIAFLQGLREILDVKALKEVYLVIARSQQRLGGKSRVWGGWEERGTVWTCREEEWRAPQSRNDGVVVWTQVCVWPIALGQWKAHASGRTSFYGPQSLMQPLPISCDSLSSSQNKNLGSRPDETACVSRFSIFMGQFLRRFIKQEARHCLPGDPV